MVEFTSSDRTVLGPGEEHCGTAIDRPVTAEQRLVGLHESAGGVAENEAGQVHIFHRGSFRAVELHQVLQPACGLHHRRRWVHSDGWVKIQRIGGGVMKPLAGSREFLENVFYEAVGCVGR